MISLNFKYIFQNAFDTYKVFDTIPFEISGTLIEGQSKTIWQTLNHLIIWREFQFRQLKDIETDFNFVESDSWIDSIKPVDKLEWSLKIDEFKTQSETIQNLIQNLDSTDSLLEKKLKIIQDSSTHLAFHLGEIILIARVKKMYPTPEQMSLFLKK
ncbi:hypothetical protein FLAN108750_12955 [Flavobacterium antarcticum]|uniref:hypothetical protein n=1 Tax=Flavobacterium antarcticum TaxID=271155 RepID=UPI0003B48048|nr:hypothetical protein [Flavobacterium antarcticum]